MNGPLVVVGGGLAAGTLVTELRGRGHDGPVTVVCAEPHPPYERPPLSKSLLRGESAVEDTYVRPREWYAEHDVTLLTGTTVRAVDLAGKRVRTDDLELDFERLVLATGCRARRLTHDPTTSEVPLHHLRDLSDAARIHEAITDGTRLLVVGGGWIGLEVAASARSLGAQVTLVEPTEQPLSGTLGVQVGAWFAELHRSHGVDLRTRVGFSRLDGRRAVLDDGTDLEVDVVVAGIGAIPNDEVAAAAGLEVDDGILVDAALRSSDPAVLAIGDVASHLHPVLDRRVRVEHWQNAQSQGRVAAALLLGDEVTYDELPSFFSDQYDAGLEYFGHVGREGAEVSVDRTDDGFVARWRRDGRVVAAAHVNAWGDADALRNEVAQA